MINGSRPTSPSGHNWPPTPMRARCAIQASSSQRGIKLRFPGRGQLVPCTEGPDIWGQAAPAPFSKALALEVHNTPSPRRPNLLPSAIPNPQFLILLTLLTLLPFLPACSQSATPNPATNSALAPSGDLSPSALAVSPDGQNLYVACSTAKQVVVFNTVQCQVTRRLALPGEPSGLALSPDGARLFVTCAGPASQVFVIDIPSGKVLQTLAAGHTALSPVLSPDGKTLFVCNRFNDAVSLFDLRRQTGGQTGGHAGDSHRTADGTQFERRHARPLANPIEANRAREAIACVGTGFNGAPLRLCCCARPAPFVASAVGRSLVLLTITASFVGDGRSRPNSLQQPGSFRRRRRARARLRSRCFPS